MNNRLTTTLNKQKCGIVKAVPLSGSYINVDSVIEAFETLEVLKNKLVTGEFVGKICHRNFNKM